MKASFRKSFLVFNKYGGKCAYCGSSLSEDELCIDHIVPRINGGSNTIENLNPSCRPCNTAKGVKDVELFRMLRRLQKSKFTGVVNLQHVCGLASLGVTLPMPEHEFYFERSVKDGGSQ